MGADRQESGQVRPLRLDRGMWRRCAAMILAGGVALGGVLTQPATAAPKAKVDIPVAPVPGQGMPIPISDKAFVVRLYGGSWMRTDDGTSWDSVQGNGRLVEGADGDGYLLRENDHGWERVALTKGAKPQTFTLPYEGMYPSFQADGYVYRSQEADSGLYFQPFSGAKQLLYAPSDTERVNDLTDLDSCRVSWTVRKREPVEENEEEPEEWSEEDVDEWSEEDRETYETRVYDTCAKKLLIAFDEAVDVRAVRGGEIIYARYDDTSDHSRPCRRPLNGGQETCIQGDWYANWVEESWSWSPRFAGSGLLLQTKQEVWEYRDFEGTLKWAVEGQCEVSEAGKLTCTDDAGIIYRVSEDGKKSKAGIMPMLVPYARIALAGGSVFVASESGATLSQLRLDGKKVEKTMALPLRATSVNASAGRAVVDRALLDRGTIADKGFLPKRATAGRMSGPYLSFRAPESDEHYVKRADNKIVFETKDDIAAQFGPLSLLVKQPTSKGKKLEVVDVETGKTVASRTIAKKYSYTQGMWGDFVYFAEYNKKDVLELFEWNYVKDPKGSKKARKIGASNDQNLWMALGGVT
ncbi:hypothetical protein [Tessaracoccus caeni]|uniref:hypothetical protein n=1 Tax=Tessaracoccus caeni TaxID=3031239 RepID=UPI0023DB9D28|nr:hypothetical protein [Tessaracoccus caeni]MDF1489793.1 hypothetical protein [Tessaracoccus caeni]